MTRNHANPNINLERTSRRSLDLLKTHWICVYILFVPVDVGNNKRTICLHIQWRVTEELRNVSPVVVCEQLIRKVATVLKQLSNKIKYILIGRSIPHLWKQCTTKGSVNLLYISLAFINTLYKNIYVLNYNLRSVVRRLQYLFILNNKVRKSSSPTKKLVRCYKQNIWRPKCETGRPFKYSKNPKSCLT